MSKIESNIQLPTVVLGGLIALIAKDFIQLLFGVATQDYISNLQQEYLSQSAQGGDLPWWVENLQTLYTLALLLVIGLFTFAFYWFVVRDNSRRVRSWEKQDAKAEAASKKTTAKKTTSKK